MLVCRNQLPLEAGGSIFNTWQFAFQYGGLKTTHNKNKTQLQTVIILGCLWGNQNQNRGGCWVPPPPSRPAGDLAGRDSLQGEGCCPAVLSGSHLWAPSPCPARCEVSEPRMLGGQLTWSGESEEQVMAGQAAVPAGTKGGHGDGLAGVKQGHLPKGAVPGLGRARRGLSFLGLL